MKKPWVLFTLVVVVSVGIVGGLALLVHSRSAARKEAEARRAEAERELDRRDAAAAFTDPTPPSRDEAAEFERVLRRFNDAVRAEDGPALADLFDAERLFDELLAHGGDGLLKKAGPRDRASFAAGFRAGARNMIANPFMRWETTVVRRVRWSADRGEAVVIATHRDVVEVGGEEVPLALKMRWWFVRGGGGWKVYDLESLDDGLRITTVMAELLRRENLPRLPELREALGALKEAYAALLSNDLETFDAALARCRRFPFPDRLAGALLAVEAAGHVARSDAEAALGCIDRAERLNPDMPLRHWVRMLCRNMLGDHEGALAASDAYFEQLGGDEDFYVQRGIALEGLGRKDEAAAAFRKSLDELPDSADAIDGLRRVLPRTGLAELGERLAKARDPGKLFDRLVPAARQGGDDAAAEVYEEALHKLRPDDPRGITARVRRLVVAGRFAEAAAGMKAGLSRVPADDCPQVLDAYLYAMLGAGLAAEAYAATPAGHAAAAFRLLADDLEDTIADDDPEEPKSVGHLRELIAAHRKRVPDDPWAAYFEGVVLQAQKKFGEAERKFAEAQAEYRKSAKPEAGGGRDWEADRFRHRRVACLHALKQGPKAYAEVGPAADTFVQLAHLYEGDRDWDALEAMVAAHRKAHGADRNGAFWAANVSYLRGKYADAAPALRKYLDGAGEKDANRWRATDRCARAYLRAGLVREAARAVAEFGAERVGPALRAAVALAEGRPAGAEAILGELTKNGGRHDHVYYDEDFARLIAAPEFAGLRKKYPDPRPAPKGPVG